jgi:hypothetical protein
MVDMTLPGLSEYEYVKAGAFDHSVFTVTVDCNACETDCTGLQNEGWHMIALPGTPCGLCAGGQDLSCAVCRGENACQVYRYDAGERRYLEAPGEWVSPAPGLGAWVRTYVAPWSLCPELMTTTDPVPVPFEVGWNQIGDPYVFAVLLADTTVTYGGVTVPFEDAAASGWVSGYVYGYNTTARAYEVVELPCGRIEAWTGYWILANVDCELTFTPIPTPPNPPTGTMRTARELGLPEPPAPPRENTLSAESILSQLRVANVPNPVRSENTTVFRVEGVRADAVDAMRVDIYGQDGQRVFTQEIAAKELAWHTVNDAGELLANGVYLYQVWVRIGGIWYPMPVQKLAVTR